jgi:hypothetical protein
MAARLLVLSLVALLSLAAVAAAAPVATPRDVALRAGETPPGFEPTQSRKVDGLFGATLARTRAWGLQGWVTRYAKDAAYLSSEVYRFRDAASARAATPFVKRAGQAVLGGRSCAVRRAAGADELCVGERRGRVRRGVAEGPRGDRADFPRPAGRQLEGAPRRARRTRQPPRRGARLTPPVGRRPVLSPAPRR